MSAAMERAIALLRRLPSVGEKTAQRMLHHILSSPPEYGRALGQALLDVVEKVHPCPVCGNLSENAPCEICSDPHRDQTLLCIVEKVSDLLAIEAAGGYRGLYHVLGGTLSPLEGRGPEQLRIQSLLERLPGKIREVIIATSAGVEGEATAMYLKNRLEPLGLKVSRIAAGVPVGGDLEYIDRSTLELAIKARRPMD
ncbi:MAG: recombination protein RecR [Deltaproteobacteria bacterium]|nr:MAG: recombination protein RecR [Deltaproteobacteria bacterium]